MSTDILENCGKHLNGEDHLFLFLKKMYYTFVEMLHICNIQSLYRIIATIILVILLFQQNVSVEGLIFFPCLCKYMSQISQVPHQSDSQLIGQAVNQLVRFYISKLTLGNDASTFVLVKCVRETHVRLFFSRQTSVRVRQVSG